MSNGIKNILLTLALLFFINTSFVSAVSDKEKLDLESANNKLKLEQIEKEIKDYNSKIANTKTEAKTLNEAIKRLEESKTNLQNQIKITEAKLDSSKSKIIETEKTISETESKINLYDKYIGDSLRNIYSFGIYKNGLLTVFSSSTLTSTFTTYNNIQKLKLELNKALYNTKDKKSQLVAIKDKELIIKKELNTFKEDLNDKKITIQNNKIEKDNLLKTTKEKEVLYSQQLKEKNELRKNIQKEILDIESKLKAIVDASKLPKQGSGVLNMPIRNKLITQYFGNTEFSTKNPQVYNGSGHNGIDFAGPAGTPIYAAEAGKVIGLDNSDLSCKGASYGKWILIRHNNGLTTLYAHLSSFNVSEGDTVQMGDKIGLLGSTGYSTGPHLHFTVYASDGVKISDPVDYRSKSCGTYMRIPLAPRNAYLNPLSYL